MKSARIRIENSILHRSVSELFDSDQFSSKSEFSVKVILILIISEIDFNVCEKVVQILNISDTDFNVCEKVVQILNISVNVMLKNT